MEMNLRRRDRDCYWVQKLKELVNLSTFPDDPPILVSMRNQLTLLITPMILVFRDASGEAPCREDFPWRVAQVAEYIAIESGLGYEKVGFRFDIECKQDVGEAPSKAMLSRLISGKPLKRLGYGVVGASARLWYEARNSLHNLHIEPKEDEVDSQEYTAHLAAEFEISSISPLSEWIQLTLHEEYQDFLKVLDEVLGSKEGKLA